MNKSVSKKRKKFIVGIVQARMGSTRLPGKTFKNIQGKPILEHIIDRIRRAKLIDKIVIATTFKEKDRVIAKFAKSHGIPCYLGSEEDVLDRVYHAAEKFDARIIVRITADDPFKDPDIIDKIVSRYLEMSDDIDYVSNTVRPTYPLGLDVEVFSFESLRKAWAEANKPLEREHVTPYIWGHPKIFRLANVENDDDLSHLRWTLDTEDDLRFTREIYDCLYKKGRVFLMKEILDLLKDKPQLTNVNRPRREEDVK